MEKIFDPEEQIKALEERHRKEIEELKASLVKPNFEKDKWYFFKNDFYSGGIFKIGATIKKGAYSAIEIIEEYGKTGSANNCFFVGSMIYTNSILASEHQIKQFLSVEAERKGFKFEAKFKNTITDVYFKDYMLACPEKPYESKHEGYVGSIWGYDMESDTLWNKGHGSFIIYRQGKWAEIIEYPKLRFGGHEVTINENEITCKDVVGTYEQLKRIYDWFVNPPDFKFGSKKIENFKISDNVYEATPRIVNEVKIGCTWGTMEEIKAILTACELQKL